MKLANVAAIYSIIVGIAMIRMWSVFYLTGSIPEIQTEPIRITLHLTAEMVTAVALIIGALGLLTKRKWGLRVYLLSMGMLLYTLIQSPGYFAQKGELALVVMFVVLIILAVSFIIPNFQKKAEF